MLNVTLAPLLSVVVVSCDIVVVLDVEEIFVVDSVVNWPVVVVCGELVGELLEVVVDEETVVVLEVNKCLLQ